MRLSIWQFICILLLIPALLINLGMMTVIDDEGIRALVALEMMDSGNFATPTLNGEFYYKKPPLFNWILILFFTLAGSADEWVARMPTVLALIGYGLTVYYFFRKHFDSQFSFLVAFLMITCGRIFFWDSMLALIDISFSWVVFTLFMLVYHDLQARKWWRFFFFSYLLTAIGFLLKGLPAIVFQALTISAVLIHYRQYRKFFSWQHLMGILVFVIIIASYLLAYYSYHPKLDQLFQTFFFESSKRTPLQASFMSTIKHLFTFPPEMVYHFLPWSILIITCLRKDFFRIFIKQPFLAYCALIFLVNISVYWISPKIFPRYLLMFPPLLFAIFLHSYLECRKTKSWQYKVIISIFSVVMILLVLGSTAPLFLERTAHIEFLWPKVIFLTSLLTLSTYHFLRKRGYNLVFVVLALVVFRIGFNWFVLPDRNANDFGDLCRQSSIDAISVVDDRMLYLYAESEIQSTNSYYLTREYGRTITRKYNSFPIDALYIIDPEVYGDLDYEKVTDFRLRFGRKTFDIGILRPN